MDCGKSVIKNKKQKNLWSIWRIEGSLKSNTCLEIENDEVRRIQNTSNFEKTEKKEVNLAVNLAVSKFGPQPLGG